MSIIDLDSRDVSRSLTLGISRSEREGRTREERSHFKSLPTSFPLTKAPGHVDMQLNRSVRGLEQGRGKGDLEARAFAARACSDSFSTGSFLNWNDGAMLQSPSGNNCVYLLLAGRSANRLSADTIENCSPNTPNLRLSSFATRFERLLLVHIPIRKLFQCYLA